MVQAERIIAAYYCSEEKLPGDRCKRCPFGYGYLDDSGDHSLWWCDDETILKDAVEILSLLIGPRRTNELKAMVEEHVYGSKQGN